MTAAVDLKLAPSRPSQRQRIFDKLDGARGRDVSASELAEISLQYCARLKELRDLGTNCGFRITNRVDRADGHVLGYYRLIWDAPRPPAFNVSAPVRPLMPVIAAGTTLPLFAAVDGGQRA